MRGWIESSVDWSAFPVKAGMQIVVRRNYYGKIEDVTLIVGDINESGGVCDDCPGVSDGDIVLRYRMLETEIPT